MVKVIIVDKGCTLKVSEIKNLEIETFYKKCKFRNNNDFDKRTTWKMSNNNYVSIYSKNKGRANSENKYDLPPPVDSDLYYGAILLVKHTDEEINNNNCEDLSIDEWNTLYTKLFGGFEDLGDEDSYSDEEEIPEHLKTKQGYSKEDGFIVSDDDEIDEEYLPEDDEEEESEAHTTTDDAEEEDGMGQYSDIDDEEEEEEEESDEDEDYESDLNSELSEESYVDSDDD